MAVSQRASGTWAVSNATTQTVTIPVGATTGDLMICVAAVKPYTAAPTIDQSWSTLFTYADGTTANGNGTGSVLLAVFYKEHTGSESNPTITWGTTSAPGGAVIVAFQKASGEVWSIQSLGNHSGWTTAESSVSRAITTTNAITSGDLVFALLGIRDDSATFTRATTAISGGPTWSGNHVEYPATHLSDTTSNDISADLGYRVASSSVASGQTITVTATLSAVETGTVSLFRVAVTVLTNASAGNAAATGAAYDAGKTIAESAGSAAGVVQTYQPGIIDNTVNAYDGVPTVAPNAGQATATGTAHDATVTTGGPPTNADAEHVVATGAAYDTGKTIAQNAGAATATGVASDAGKILAQSAGQASGTGAANDAGKTVAPTVAAASATGAAYQPGGTASASMGSATATGAAAGPSSTVAASIEAAAATVAAYQPAITTGSSVNVDAGHASATGAASDAAATVAGSAGSATGTGAATDPAPTLQASAGHASATGAGHDATCLVVVAVNAGLAEATGSAHVAALSISPTSGYSEGTGTGYDAGPLSVSGNGRPPQIVSANTLRPVTETVRDTAPTIIRAR